jgi:sRNA-binding carbon storage regulator CsrA
MKKGLLLSRRENEGCLLYKDGKPFMRIMVEEIGGGRARIRFIADESIEILRNELVEPV